MDSYLQRFLKEYENARVNISLTETGYDMLVKALYPKSLDYFAAIMQLAWIVIGTIYALRITSHSVFLTIIIVIVTLFVAYVVSTHLPENVIFSVFFTILGVLSLPYSVLAVTFGLYGIRSLTKRIKTWYGRDIAIRWVIGSEQQFLQSITEQIVTITPNQYANDDTYLLLNKLSSNRL